MDIQVLVTTMSSKPVTKIEEMNLNDVDVIIANQQDKCAYEEIRNGEHTAKIVTTNTRGVSINRNLALMYATAEIIVFADDDMVFIDGFQDIIFKEFSEHPKSDAIKFYCESLNSERQLSYKRPHKFQRAQMNKIMSAGVVGLAVKRRVLNKHDLRFPESLGPGTDFMVGEDSIFIKTLLRAKIHVCLSPKLICYVKQESSSWFSAYNDSYFFSIGYAYARIYGRISYLAALRRAYVLHRGKENNMSYGEIFSRICKGIKFYYD